MSDRWSRKTPTMARRLLALYDRIVTPFSHVPVDRSAAAVLEQRYVHIETGDWSGRIAYLDSAPHLTGHGNVETIVFTHGLMCSGFAMWSDVIAWLLERSGPDHVRVIALDLPGHGLSDKPDPAFYDYSMSSMATIVSAALDGTTLGIEGRYTHVTQSLGYLLSMHDVLSGSFRTKRWISYGTSPEQIAILLTEPLSRRLRVLGNRTAMEFFFAVAPRWFVSYADFFDWFVRWVGVGAPEEAAETFMSKMNDPAATKAWFAILRDGLGEYKSMGRRMYSAPLPSDVTPIRARFFAGAQDIVTPVRGIRTHVERLNTGAAVCAELSVVEGTHFGMGAIPMRRAIFDAISEGLTRSR